MCDSFGLWVFVLEEVVREVVFVWVGVIRGRWRGLDGGGYGFVLVFFVRD